MRRRKFISRLLAIAFLAVALSTANTLAAAETKTYKNGDYEFVVAPAPAWTLAHEIPAKWDAAAPGASDSRWRNWLVDTQIDRRHSARTRFYDRVYEPVSSEMVQDAGKYQIWFSPDHQKLILHRVEIRRDGIWSDRLAPKAITLARRENEFEHDMANGLVSALIVLNDVRAGDLVRVSYTIDGDNPILAGLVNETLSYAASDPILDRYSRILFDGNAKLSEHEDQGTPKPAQKRERDLLEWTANQHAVAGLIDEGNYPPWYDEVPSIDVGETRSWGDIEAWARTLYPAPQALPAELEQRVGEWRKLADPEQRIAAALRAVQEEVRYFGTEMGESTHRPSEPAETWTRRYGDCKDKARLLATILQRLGVQAYPALVSYERGKAVADLPPAASSFDHVIVQARLGDTILWLDATMTQQRGSPLTIAPNNFGVALPIGTDVQGLSKVVAPTSAVDRLHVTEHLQPSASERTVTLEVQSEYEGAAADRMRRRMKGAGIDKIERDFLDFYRKRYGEVSAVSAFDLKDDEASNKLKINEHYLLKNPWIESVVGKRTLDIYADALSGTLALPKTAERKAPMAVAHPLELEQKTLLELPEGWRWLSDPVKRRLEDPAVEYDLEMAQSSRLVTVTQRARTLQDVVQPNDYAKHFALLRDVSDSLGRRLVLGVSAKDAASERDKRLENLMRNILDDKHAGSARGGN